jgi:AcrR family transcriptional regulator
VGVVSSRRAETDGPSLGPLLRRALDTVDAVGADATSERILAGALAQFEDFGVSRTTMEDVARRSGVSRITIYRRFSTKDALVEAVLLRECARFFVALDEAVAGLPTTDERLVEGFALSLEFVRTHILLGRLLATEPASLLPHLTLEAGPIIRVAREFLADRLGREVSEGRLEPLDVQVAGEMLVRVVLSFLLTPDSVVRMDSPQAARDFARRHLAPSLHVSPSARG